MATRDGAAEAGFSPDARKVLDAVAHRFSSQDDALFWYANRPLPGYGKLTARDLVERGDADWVVETIKAIEAGVYA